MDLKESFISNIIELEWQMFTSVNSASGKTSCQNDPETFTIMRRSQTGTLPEEVLESYLDDLKTATAQGRNLMAERYAWMMEFSSPAEFRNFAGQLPPIDTRTMLLIEEIVSLNVVWKAEVSKKYPHLSARGRPLYSHQDTPCTTSFETYLRGELKSYSAKTIRLLHEFTLWQKKKGVNEVEANLLNQVRQYGYSSLEDAEKRSGCLL